MSFRRLMRRAQSWVLGLTVLVALLPGIAHARPAVRPVLPVPQSLYPSGAQVFYHASLSNADMDQGWGHDPDGLPNLHVWYQDTLHRRSGWIEGALLYRHDSYLIIGLIVSDYDVTPDGRHWNQVAFKDWQAAVAGVNRVPLARSQPKGLLPSGVEGYAETRVLTAQQDGPTVAIAGWWGGSREVEALATFSPEVMSLQAAKRMLARQVSYATRLLQGTALPQAQT